MNNSFPKSEKLCGQLRIAALYKEGRRFTAFPLRVTFRKIPDEIGENCTPHVLVWAPKSLFKHAVDRNRLRRFMREAYRLQAQPLRELCEQQHLSLQIAFNYMDRELRSQEQIAKAMQKALKKIAESDGENTATTRQRHGNDTATWRSALTWHSEKGRRSGRPSRPR